MDKNSYRSYLLFLMLKELLRYSLPYKRRGLPITNLSDARKDHRIAGKDLKKKMKRELSGTEVGRNHFKKREWKNRKGTIRR